jgi:hypothetical protein
VHSRLACPSWLRDGQCRVSPLCCRKMKKSDARNARHGSYSASMDCDRRSLSQVLARGDSSRMKGDHAACADRCKRFSPTTLRGRACRKHAEAREVSTCNACVLHTQ